MQPLLRANARTSGSCVTAQGPAQKSNSDGSFGIEAFARESQALRRRVARIRRAGMLEPAPNLVIRQATDAGELAQAYSLVHDVFVNQGYISPQCGGMRVRPFEALPEMITLVAKDGDRVVGVLSIVPDSPDLGLPSDQAFPAELEALRAKGRRLAEVTNLALDPAYRSTGVFFELSRACAAHTLDADLDDLFISISPGHSIFFETILGFAPWGGRRSYCDDHEDMVEGLRLDLTRFEQQIGRSDELLDDDAFLRGWFFEENPHYDAVRWSIELARSRFLNPDVLRDLFVTRTEYLLTCGDRVLTALRERWGTDLLSILVPHAFEGAELNVA